MPVLTYRDALNHALAPEMVAPATRPGGCAARRREQYVSAVMSRKAADAGRRADNRVLTLPKPAASSARRGRTQASSGLAG